MTHSGTAGDPREEQTEDIGFLVLQDSVVAEGPARRVERTRALLAFLLLILLSLTVLGLLLLVGLKRITTGELIDIAGVLIAPIVGLLGAAAGYYYGRSSK